MKSLNWIALALFLILSVLGQTQASWAKLRPAQVKAACAASTHCASFPGTNGGFGGCFTSGKGLCFSCTKSSCWINMEASPPTGEIKPRRSLDGVKAATVGTGSTGPLQAGAGREHTAIIGGGARATTLKANAATAARQFRLQ